MRAMEKLGFAVTGTAVVLLELAAIASWQGWLKPGAPAALPGLQVSQAAPPPAPKPSQPQPQPSEPEAAPRPEDGYYAQLRNQIRWVETRLGNDSLPTPDLHSRMLLAKSAAHRAGLQEVGLGFQDVYGLINAETSWVPRTGIGRDGTPSLGVAQFEPATARALGVRNPNDLVEAVHAAAAHMKEAAAWSSNRIARLKLDEDAHAKKLREGVSIYYNLSSRGRAVWNGKNTNRLPRETRHHIQNAAQGARQAQLLDASLTVRRGAGTHQSIAMAATSQSGG